MGEGENAVSRRFDYSFLEPSEVEGGQSGGRMRVFADIILDGMDMESK